jgi:protocatechuate 3,4-dioxygenase, alpha subunit
VAVASTPSQTVGPFYSFALCEPVRSELVPSDAPGAVRIHGHVLDGAGDPVADAMVEIWGADADGRYANGWGRCGTNADGEFTFVTVKPGGVQGQAPHVVVMVFARGLLKQVLTRMYFPDEDAANAADPLLSALDDEARATLVADADGDAFRFDVRLQGDRQTVFFAV